MSDEIVVVPFNFGANKPNDSVSVPKKSITVIYQTIRDDDLYDDVYRGKLLTRIVKLGLEILADEPIGDIVDRWAEARGPQIARFTRLPTNMDGDDVLVAVNVSNVTDVRPVSPNTYADGYSTLIFMGGLKVAVTEDPGVVKARLGWNI